MPYEIALGGTGSATAAGARIKLGLGPDSSPTFTNGTFTGNLSVGGTSTLTGNTTIGGTLGVTGQTSLTTLRLSTEDDLSLSSTTHAFQIGPSAGINLVLDGNEIMARNNGATSTLFLNASGGTVDIGSGGINSAGAISGTAGTFTDFVSITRTGTPQLQLTRSASTVNTNIQLTNDSGSVYIGHGPANTFAVGNSSNLSSSANQWMTVDSTKAELINGQLKFPATQIASADANTLDDYEEGTWTPRIEGATTAGTGTYGTQRGTYIKIGRLVYINCLITWTAHTGTGALLVAGLPFAATNNDSVMSFDISGLTYTAGATVCGLVNGSTLTIIVREMNPGVSVSSIAIDTVVAGFRVAGCYAASS